MVGLGLTDPELPGVRGAADCRRMPPVDDPENIVASQASPSEQSRSQCRFTEHAIANGK